MFYIILQERKKLITYYSFNEINKKEIDERLEVSKNHKFLYDSVNKEIKYYDSIDNKKCYVNYFDEIFFEVAKSNKKPIEYKFLACHITEEYKNITDENISLEIRGTRTLKINEYNCYDNTDIKVIFSENAFAFIEKFKESTNKFEKIYVLFLLAHAYNLYNQKFIREISLNYKKGNFKEIIELRKKIFVFDLNCFFINPVDYKKQQLNSLWKYMQNIYFVEQNHKEMKSQINDLVYLIEIDLKERAEREKEIAEELYLKRTNILTLIAIVIAMFSLISAYKDFSEMGGVEYLKYLIGL